jgi:hypothetical protein
MTPITSPAGLGSYLATAYPHASPVTDYCIIGDQLTVWNEAVLGPLSAVPTDIVITAAKSQALQALASRAKAMRLAISETDDPARLLGWKQQADDCQALTSGIVSDQALARIDAALAIRHARPGKEAETRADFAAKTLHWAHRDAIAANQANELQHAAEEMINACTTPEQIGQVMTAIAAKAQAMIAAEMAVRNA